MNRYGDSPLGMVESALEFLDICESENYQRCDLQYESLEYTCRHSSLSIACRLVWRRATTGRVELSLSILGVTEAGDGEDGRIKSAIGIGALLEDGIGDTIRVSLTEDPVYEVPVAEKIIEVCPSGLSALASEDGKGEIGFSRFRFR